MVNILLVEDNLADILLVERALAEYRVEHLLHIVRDGGEALAFMARMGLPGEQPCPDIVLLDVNLPKIDGLEVLREFRKHPACARTPVIAVTSSHSVRERAKMAALGVVRYFKKPSDLDAFLQIGAVVRDVIAEGGT